MNALFLTQGTSLPAFWDLMQALKEPWALDRVGFYVSHSPSYRELAAEHPELEAGSVSVVKEWEIVERARTGSPDLARIATLEQRLGDPTLWGAVVADRRVSFGPRAAMTQDYAPRYGQAGSLRLLEEGAAALEQLFDQVQPDVVVSFICVTFGEYLSWRLARTRGIPVLNLRPARIRNLMTYEDTIFEPANRVRSSYQAMRSGQRDPKLLADARAFLGELRGGLARYEGVIPPARRPFALPMRLGGAFRKASSLVREEWAYRFQGGHLDHSAGSPIQGLAYTRVLAPWRARQVETALSSRYLTAGELGSLDYAFFPLHTEPEVTINTNSPWCRNQIEVARHLAMALPAHFTLLVKEHPASIGRRPVSYYEKLLQIPNLRLADPALESRAVVESAKLVGTIAGTIGLEALLRGKPVVTLGGTPYSFLPDSMTRRAAFQELPQVVHELLTGYRRDESALEDYVAAVIGESVAIDWYTALLQKAGLYRQDDETPAQQRWSRDIRALAQYTASSLDAIRKLGVAQESLRAAEREAAGEGGARS